MHLRLRSVQNQDLRGSHAPVSGVRAHTAILAEHHLVTGLVGGLMAASMD